LYYKFFQLVARINWRKLMWSIDQVHASFPVFIQRPSAAEPGSYYRVAEVQPITLFQGARLGLFNQSS